LRPKIALTVAMLGLAAGRQCHALDLFSGDQPRPQGQTAQQTKGAPNQASTQSSPQRSPEPGETELSQRDQLKSPVVVYAEGQLTILAEYSRLSDVLAQVRKVMGTDVELPPGISGQIVWAHLGPGPALGVLRDLLDGTDYNYVIQASDVDTDAIRSISLSLKFKGSISGNLQAGARGTQEQETSRRIARPNGSMADNPDPGAVADNGRPADSASGDPSPSPADAKPASASLQPATDGTRASPITPAGRTAERMIQQLQSMYQQRKQIQQQQNQQNQGPQPTPPPQN